MKSIFVYCRKMYKFLLFSLVFAGCTISVLLVGANGIRKVVIDVDAGVDDYQALVFLLNADAKKAIKIEAIICSKGNADIKNVQKNVIRLLDTVGRLDIPVYAGPNRNLLNPISPLQTWFGNDGFGDIEYKKQPNLKPVKKTWPSVALSKLLKSHAGKITIVTLGPLTNIGLTVVQADEQIKKVKEFFIMGGNYGDETEAEYNFKSDPESVKNLLDIAETPITMLTWQACEAANIMFKWRFNVTLNNPIWNLNENAERALYVNSTLSDVWYPCDGLLALTMLEPEKMIKKSSEQCVSVETGNEARRGEIVLKFDCPKTNVKVIEEIDVDYFKEQFVENFNKVCKGKNGCKNVY